MIKEIASVSCLIRTKLMSSRRDKNQISVESIDKGMLLGRKER